MTQAHATHMTNNLAIHMTNNLANVFHMHTPMTHLVPTPAWQVDPPTHTGERCGRMWDSSVGRDAGLVMAVLYD